MAFPPLYSHPRQLPDSSCYPPFPRNRSWRFTPYSLFEMKQNKTPPSITCPMQKKKKKKIKMRHDCGLALGPSPRVWERLERHREGCRQGRLQHPVPSPTPRKLALAPPWRWWGCQCFDFLAFHLCLGSWLKLSEDLGRGPGWWQGVSL